MRTFWAKRRARASDVSFEIAVNVFKGSNHQGKTCNETHRRLRMPVYESRHMVELGSTEKQYVAAGGEKRIDATK